MKSLFILSLLALSSLHLQAQTNLDSLYAVWQDETQADSSRTKAYHKYIWDGFLFPQPDSAFRLADKLFAFADERAYPKAKNLAYNLQGISHAVRGNNSEALTLFQQSLEIVEELDDKKLMASVLKNIGKTYGQIGNNSKALDSYQQVLKIAKELEDKKLTAEALTNLGIVYSGQGKALQALDYYQQVLKIAEELEDKSLIAEALNNLGGTQTSLGNYQDGLDYFQQSLKIAEELKEKEEIASVLNNIGVINKMQGNYPQALDYFKQSLKIYEELNNKQEIARRFNNIGDIYRRQGNYLQALDYYQQSLEIVEAIKNKRGTGNALNSIGLLYENLNNQAQALDYYQRSLKIAEEVGDKSGILMTLNNIGNIYDDQHKHLEALDYYNQSLTIAKEIGDKGAMASTLNNIGNVHKAQLKYPEAMDYYQQSLKMAEELGDKQKIANTLGNIGLLSAAQGNHNTAVDRCRSAYILNKEIGEIANQAYDCSCLYKSYKALGNMEQALSYHEEMLILHDSLKAKETNEKLQQMEYAKQAFVDSIARAEEERLVQEAHEAEIRKKNNTRNLYLAGGLFFLLLAGGLYSRNRYIKRSRDVIAKEKDRSDNLLLNILPAEIAEELKTKGSADAREYEQVSILFTDFQDFTHISEKLSAKELVAEINYCFRAFDAICEKYAVEKIKTIGDSYMAAGGLPVPQEASVKNTVLAALEMAAFIVSRKAEREAEGKKGFAMRAGVHTGNVVAGIVGVKKFQYDVWGDTVNTASRMESSGEVGKVNISQFTYEILKDDPQFSFQYRGKVEAKGKGEVEMWFVEMTQ